jgi:hypothetical protein
MGPFFLGKPGRGFARIFVVLIRELLAAGCSTKKRFTTGAPFDFAQGRLRFTKAPEFGLDL